MKAFFLQLHPAAYYVEEKSVVWMLLMHMIDNGGAAWDFLINY